MITLLAHLAATPIWGPLVNFQVPPSKTKLSLFTPNPLGTPLGSPANNLPHGVPGGLSWGSVRLLILGM